MLFKSRFHRRIADGTVTLTVRNWSRPQARVGGRYTVGGSLIEVTLIEAIKVDDLDDGLARAAGFAGHHDLLEELLRPQGRPPELPGSLSVVHFKCLGPAPEAQPEPPLDAVRLAYICGRLDALDASGPGPWTRTVLRMIDRNPGTVSRVLAAELGRERLEFKADVRKLKALGLTRSLLVGYELTSLGRTILDETGEDA